MGGGNIGVSTYGTYTGNCDDCDETECEHHGKHRAGCPKWGPNDDYLRREEKQWHPWDY